ncbi:MAG TPA: hypothetical protein VEG38_08410, partial [Acidimicrobiia bacterium]|nr:hypothetical protein [Acidimicrobiia bacterium]
GAGGIVLSFKTQQMNDPASDPSWASLNTFVSWQLDGNNDQKPETLIRYSLDRDTPGVIVGEVTYWPGPGVPAKHCDAKSAFNPATGYSLTFDPGCIGNPAAVSYRVQLTYDTKPGTDKPPLAFDVTPDTGLAGPVPIVVATAPAAAPPAPAPSGSPDPAQAAPPAAGAPSPSPSPPAAAPGAKNTPKATTKPTAPARTPSSAAPKPAAPAPTAGPAADPSAELAATGPSGARWLGALGGALMLLGGLGLMTPAEGRRRTAA